MDYKTFTERDILERIDEYTLYCHYLGYEVIIGGRYRVPNALRFSNNMPPDVHTSFGVFERRKGGLAPHEFLWKDQAGGYTGDIFELVRRMNGYSTKYEAMQHILSEFGLGGKFKGTVKFFTPIDKKYQSKISIEVTSKPWNTRELLYWDRYHIDKSILDTYFTTVIQMYWLTEEQKKPIMCRGMGFAYRIFDKYQLYFPYAERDKKFRNDWNELCVPGHAQLQFNSDTCIITKAMKDVMCMRSFGYEVVAPRGENILLPDEFITFLKRHYRRILVLFDNDMKHKGDEYEFDKIYVPKIMDTDKDPSDFCDNHGEKETRKMLKSIIHVT